MSLEPEFRDATGMDGEIPKGYVTNRIVIRRILTSDNRDIVDCDWPDDASLLELLGMLDFARTMIWEAYNSVDGEEVDDD